MVKYGDIDDIQIGGVVEYDGNGKLIKGNWYIVKSFDKSNGRIKVVINDNGDTSTHTFNFMKLVKTKYNVGDTILHKPTKTTQVVKAIEMKLNVPCYRYEKGGFDNIKGMECRGDYELDVPRYRYTEDGFVNIKRIECREDHELDVPKTTAPDLSGYDFKQNPEEEKMKDNLEIDVKLNGKNVCAVKNEVAASLRPKTELEIASYPFSAVCYSGAGDKIIVRYFKNEDKQKKFKKKYLQSVKNIGHTVILYNVSGAFTTKTPIVKITI